MPLSPDERRVVLKRVFNCLVGSQWLLAIVAVFGDFGFDHPGRFGLDFEDFILLFVVYLIVTISAVVVGIKLGEGYAGLWLVLGIVVHPIIVPLADIYF